VTEGASARLTYARAVRTDEREVLERELENVVVDCAVCGRTVHYVGRTGGTGRALRGSAPHATPKLNR
jgi:molybdopterin biosynthesis enzyme MoaB